MHKRLFFKYWGLMGAGVIIEEAEAPASYLLVPLLNQTDLHSNGPATRANSF